jgi:hypothetical protein
MPNNSNCNPMIRVCRSRDHMVVGLQIPVQSMQVLNPAHGEAYSIQHYVIVCYFFHKPYFFFAQNKNQNIF